MGVFDIDLTRPRRVKAAGMFVCAAVLAVIVVALALTTGSAGAFCVLLVTVPFAVAGVLWLYADRAAHTAEQRGQDPQLYDDLT